MGSSLIGNFCVGHAASMQKMSKQSQSRGFARLPRLIGHALVVLYRFTLAPLIGPRCRHLPSCSEYADESIIRFGMWAGGWMALARILRCQPWGTHGLDFVPARVPPSARWWAPWRYGLWRGTNATPTQ
jgi:hypothetical protein